MGGLGGTGIIEEILSEGVYYCPEGDAIHIMAFYSHMDFAGFIFLGFL
jgi:hypothetical protein